MQAPVAVGALAGDGEQVAVGRDRQPPGRQAGGRGGVGEPVPVRGIAAHPPVGGGAEQPAVPVEGHRAHRAAIVAVGEQRLAGGGVPHPHAARGQPGGEARAVRRSPPGRSPAPAGRAAGRPASPSRCRTHRCRTCRPTGRRWRRRRTAACRPGSARRRRSRPPRRCRSAGAAPRARPRRAATRGGWSCRSRRWPAGARRRPPPDARWRRCGRPPRCAGTDAAAARPPPPSSSASRPAARPRHMLNRRTGSRRRWRPRPP